MTWRVESSPSASSTRTGILGSIRVSLLDPSAAAASASSSPSPSSKSTTFTNSSTPPPISTGRTPRRSGFRQPLLSLFSPPGRSWKTEETGIGGLRNQMPVCERTTKPKRRGLYTYTRPLPQTGGPCTRWPG